MGDVFCHLLPGGISWPAPALVVEEKFFLWRLRVLRQVGRVAHAADAPLPFPAGTLAKNGVETI